MRLITSTSLEDTAEHFWQLRSLAERLVAPVTALLARQRTLAAYEKLSPEILEDIGLPARTVVRAKEDGATLAEAARRERAAAFWRAGNHDPFGARVPFSRRPRTIPAAAARSAADRAATEGAARPAALSVDRLEARLPFARTSSPERPSRQASKVPADKPAERRDTRPTDPIEARLPFTRAHKATPPRSGDGIAA